MDNIDQRIKLKEDIETTEARLKELYVEKDKLEDPVKRLATLLHNKICKNHNSSATNHTHCHWYEERDWATGYAKPRYINMAQRLLTIADFDTLWEIISALDP